MRKVLHNALLLLYCVYLYFVYHLLLIPAFAEFSFYALLVIPLLLLVFWLIPAERRKEMIVFTFLFLFLDQAIVNINQKIGPMPYLWVIFIGLFMYPLVKFYAKIKLPALAIALALAVVFNVVFPDRTAMALTHLYPKWTSEKSYIGSVTDSFAVAVVDLDGDGASEIVTLGNRDFYPDGTRKAKYSFVLEDEPLHLLVWTWQDGKMVRVPNEELDAQAVSALLPKDFIGFPYYALSADLVLEPLVQRLSLSESMMQFGKAPFQALRLNTTNLARQFVANGYLYDQLAQSGPFENVVLRNGLLSGSYNGTDFAIPSDATRIVGTIGLGDETQGLLVMARDLHLLQMIDGQLETTHTLTREMQNSLALSDFITTDLSGDGNQQLIVTYPYSTIIEPTADGGWNMLWKTDERSFNIKDVGSFTAKSTPEIIALRKSAVRATDISYLTSYRYEDHKLLQNWKVFMRDIDTATFGDIDGDGHNELITTTYGKHKIYVWGKHNIPVTMILASITLLLILYLAGRRMADVRRNKAQA